MDRRACIYVRIGWLVLAAGALFLASVRIAQQRFQVAGMCGPAKMGGSEPGIMIYDSYSPRIYCLPLPPNPPTKEELAPNLPPSDKKTEI